MQGQALVIAMAFEHHPGLAALHAAIGVPNEPSVAEELEAKKELEEITKELQEEGRIERPKRRGFR